MQLEVFFDYCCPYCYVGHAYLKELMGEFPEVGVVWRPCEAHPEPEERMVISSATGWWDALKPVVDEAGLEMNLPHNPVPHSNLAIETALEMERQGVDMWAWHERMYQAVFVDSADIEDWDVLLQCVEEVGGDVAKAGRALETREHREAQKAINQHAFGPSRVWAVPAFVAGEKRLDAVEGVGVRRDQLRQLLRSL